MLLKIKKKLKGVYQTLYSSIAFYPAIISILFAASAVILLSFNSSSLLSWLEENTPKLVINDTDSARTLLSVIIGGIISLTVFSFSMVMLTLNQASSNFSPRILPGLVSEKKNQIVLGCYLGTAIFSIIVLLSVRSGESLESISALSVLIAINLFILCLGLFIYFINHISTSIQIDNIMNKIYRDTFSKLEKITESEEGSEATIDISETSYIRTTESVFYHGLMKERLSSVCEENKMNIHITSHIGQFLHKGQKIAHCDITLSAEQEEAIRDALIVSNNHSGIDTPEGGFNQLTEIGVKAMSPGINDPGTAITTLDYISSLLMKRSRMYDEECYQIAGGNYNLVESRLSFNGLMHNILGQYRLYCSDNLILMLKMKKMLTAIYDQDNIKSKYKKAIKEQMDALIEDAKRNIKNEYDLNVFLNNG